MRSLRQPLTFRYGTILILKEKADNEPLLTELYINKSCLQLDKNEGGKEGNQDMVYFTVRPKNKRYIVF